MDFSSKQSPTVNRTFAGRWRSKVSRGEASGQDPEGDGTTARWYLEENTGAVQNLENCVTSWKQ